MRLVVVAFSLLFSYSPLFGQLAHAPREFVKLPPQVNISQQSELAPVVSADGKTLYFTRARMGVNANETVFDVWKTEITNDTSYSRAEILGGNLASRFGIAVTSVSPDNNVLYLMGKLYEATPPDERIYRTVQSREGWEIPKPVKIRSLRPRGTFTDYSFGPDQRTMVMSIDRDSSMGGRDLYISFYDEVEDAWSQPLWLGSRVNSIYNEITPFLAPDGRTLYFSSERPNGIGECDVYKVIRKDDSWQNWTYPENLGPSVNRPGRTMYYSEDAKGKYAYFVWRKDQSSYTDIYRAKIEHSPVIPTVLVEGRVIDERGRPIEATIKYGITSAPASIGVARSHPTNGTFAITLPANQSYTIDADRIGFIPSSTELTLDGKSTVISVTLTLNSLKVGSTARLNNIFFETNKSILYESSFAELDRLVSLMREDPQLAIAVEGHTDDVGGDAHNDALSLARASAVKDYLVGKGIEVSRIAVEGFGASRPTLPNSDDQSRATNRRVEFKILKRGSEAH